MTTSAESEPLAGAPRHTAVVTSRLCVVLLACAFALVAACAPQPDEQGGSGSDATVGTDGGTDGGTDTTGTEPVLQVSTMGGFVMPGTDFQSVPRLTVYPDGTTITAGPVIAIYPGPLLPNLLVNQLPGEQVEELVERARDVGLLADDLDFGDPPVADAPTTVVTIRAPDGTRTVHEVPALGFEPGLPGAPEVQPGLTEEQVAARQSLSTFLDEASGRVDGATGDSYAPKAFALLVPPADLAAAPEAGIEATVVDWPLSDVRLADLDTCHVVDGEAAATLLPVFEGANTLTRFSQDGETYALWVRPLLPGETECPPGT